MNEATDAPTMTGAAPSRLFVRLFAGAAIAHIAGNRPFALDTRGVFTLALGLVAAIALVHPGRRAIRVLLAILVLATVWTEAPFIGNHWIVAGFVAVALLATSFREDWWEPFAATARGILLVFYAFAAFAKLNAGFFDPVHSCGLFYANQSLASWGVAQIPGGGAIAVTIAATTAIIELAVPVLLIVRRTRPYGVMLGFTFHFLISLDLWQHFYDFTALLFALFALFIPDEVTRRWDATAERHRPSIAALAVASLALTAAAVAPPTPLSLWVVRTGSFFVWIPVGALLVLSALRIPTTPPPTIRLMPAGAAGFALVGLVFLNGLTPYLGLKTAYGFNMYANLSTTGGDSNHFVVRRTAELIDVPMVTITESSDPGLAEYVGSGLLVPERNVLHHLASRPDASVTYIGDNGVVTGSGAELGAPLPLLVEKFGLFRSIDSEDPPRCQTVWLAAY